MHNFFGKKPGDPIVVFVNGKRIEGTVNKIEEKVIGIINPRGVVIDIPIVGKIELGE